MESFWFCWGLRSCWSIWGFYKADERQPVGDFDGLAFCICAKAICSPLESSERPAGGQGSSDFASFSEHIESPGAFAPGLLVEATYEMLSSRD